MVYLDYNATTPLSDAAKAWMSDAVSTWGNPSSVHGMGRSARELLEKSRSIVADALAATPDEVVFTSCGSESNASVLVGKALAVEGLRVLVSPVEHSSIRDLAPTLNRLGAKVEWMKLLPSGALDCEHLKAAVESFRPHLVSLMVVNNETGIVFPIPEVSDLCRATGAELHVDAIQGLGKLPAEKWKMADYLSVSAHKVNGPKGTGALRVASSRKLAPLFFGGNNELKRRGGTINLIGIAGFAGALSQPISSDDRGRMERLRNDLERRLLNEINGAVIQGAHCERAPHTTNLRVSGVRAEALLAALDLDGILLSAGAACSSGATKASPIMRAMGLPEEQALECFRLSLGKTTTAEELNHFADRLRFHVERIRSRRGRG